MRRVLALLVLVGIIVAAVYVWQHRQGGAVGLPQDAQNAIGNVGDKLGTVGDKIGDKLGSVGDKLGAVGERLSATKTSGSVKAALELNRSLAPYSIEVSAEEGGLVVLRGQVPRDELRVMAERVATSVPDVTQVRNEITLNPGLAAPSGAERTLGENIDDRALEAKVSLAFSLNREMKGNDVTVKAFKRDVVLAGEATSEAQKQLAVAIAREAPGVGNVTDGIRVRGGAAGASGATPAERARSAQQALAAHPSLRTYGLKAQDVGGRIVLTGRVRTAAEKDLAGYVAREATGGTAVENNVEIHP